MLHIRELVVKFTVNTGESPPSSGQNGSNNNQNASASDAKEVDKDLVVAECVEQVMAILRDKLEK
jgi:Family of unknown function (DUF5908)